MPEPKNRLMENLLDSLSGGIKPEAPARLRVRGAVRTRGGAAVPPPPRIVLVEVPPGREKPDYEEIRSKVEGGPLDIYYLVRGKERMALGPRELDPDNKDDKLLIAQLESDETIRVQVT